jgi:hypothetical protein
MIKGIRQCLYSFEYWRYFVRYKAPDKLQLSYRRGQFFKTLYYPIFGES